MYEVFNWLIIFEFFFVILGIGFVEYEVEGCFIMKVEVEFIVNVVGGRNEVFLELRF